MAAVESIPSSCSRVEGKGKRITRIYNSGWRAARRRASKRYKAGHVTTHYSAPEIEALIQASEKVCELGARKSHALTRRGARTKQQVLDFMVVREGLEPSTSAL